MNRNIPLLATFLFLLMNLQAQVVINEYSASNLSDVTDNFNQYEDWVEIYNSSASSADIGGYYLSDKPDEPMRYQFPEGLTLGSGERKVIWLTGRNITSGNHLHSNFKLTQTKDEPESVVLSDQTGNIIDQVLLERTQKDHSRGRTTDGSVSWAIFTNPTPGNSNSSSTAYSAYAQKPIFSDTAGFYNTNLSVEITNPEPSSSLYYTTNGSEPNESSTLYSGPIDISNTQIVIARTFSNDPGILPSFLEFHTYFINQQRSLAVMSLSAEQLDNLLNGNQSLRPFGTFEYFNEEGVRTTFGYGEFNEHGQDSWVHDQRSIDYISRDECGYNYAIREQMIPLSDRDEYQRVILRAAGDDNYPGIDTSALLRDYFVQNTAEKEGFFLDVRKGQKGTVYANGQFWGVYGYREKVSDHDFTNYYYNQGKYDIYFLKLWGGSWAEYGGQDAWNDWNDLHNFIKNNDMADPNNYDYVLTRLDVRSLADYIIMNSFVVCSDWINWNVGWWRGTNPNGTHQRWGYILWDEDATFAHYINYTGVPGISPTTSPCYPEGLTSDPEEHIVMLNELLENEDFYTYYVNRYIDMYNTAFQPSRMISYLDEIEMEMMPEMPDHVNRWGGTVAQWQNNVQKIRNFITSRHNYLPNGLTSCYNLDGPYELNFAVEPANAGEIRINSHTVENSFWGGMYFGGIDIELEAFNTDPSWEFDHWELFNHEVSPSDTSHLVTLELTTGDYIKAIYTPKLFNDSLVINEINYNADGGFDTEDWVEFYNPHDYILDISGWSFKDSDDTHVFTFPEFTVMEPHGYIVLSRDTAIFSSFFPDVENLIGNMDFGLSSGGELIRLFNDEGILIDTVHYDNNEPWPTEPDGGGPSLELKQWDYDNALPESWAASEDYGTPGEMNGYVVAVSETESIAPFTWTIYPNPADDKAILQITTGKHPQNATVVLRDIVGRVIFDHQHFAGDRIEIDCENYNPGTYFLTIYTENNVFVTTKKLVVR